MYKIVRDTFNLQKEKLPTIKEVKQHIRTDNEWGLNLDDKRHLNVYRIRDEYIKKSFPILTHEFISTVKNMIEDLKIINVSELSGGTGWFTYWLKNYGVNILDCIDNKSWKHREYLKLVKKYDSIKYVKKHPEITMFILSWPYMDTVAERIWKSMKRGQYLLYIGEQASGCTANDKFFELVENKEVIDNWDMQASFISFWGIHDRPILYRK